LTPSSTSTDTNVSSAEHTASLILSGASRTAGEGDRVGPRRGEAEEARCGSAAGARRGRGVVCRPVVLQEGGAGHGRRAVGRSRVGPRYEEEWVTAESEDTGIGAAAR
jgi:hypothetical protein